MKAAVQRRYGSPGVVTIDEMPKPVLRDAEVLVRKLGADAVVDYTAADFARAWPTYDVIFDVAGKSSFSHCRPALNRAGTYLTTAPSPAILLQRPWPARLGRDLPALPRTGGPSGTEKGKDLTYHAELAEP